MLDDVNENLNITSTNNELESTEIETQTKKRFKDYIFFFSGQQISILGSSVVSFVLIWWITETTQSELMLGIASLVSLGPFLIIAPFSGVIADRVDKKRLLLIVDALQASFTVGLTIIFMLYYTPNEADPTVIANKTLLITAVFITLGLRGMMQSFHTPAVASMIPTMVPQKHLSRINGLAYLIQGVISIAGPAIGAVLLRALGVSLTMWIDVITFGVAVIPLIIIKIPSLLAQAGVKQPSFFKQFKEGLTVIKEIKGMIALLFISTLINFFFTPLSTLLPYFIQIEHGGNELNYAMVIGLLQAGVIAGGLFMVFYKGFKNKTRTAIITVSFMFVGIASLIFVPTTIASRFWLIGIILFLTLSVNPIGNVSFQTVMQTLIPKDKFGRVSSVTMFMAMAITPIGNFLSGVIGEYIPDNLIVPSSTILFTSSAIIGVVLMILLYFLTPARNLDKEFNKKIVEMNGEKSELVIENEEIDEIFETAEESNV